MAFFGKRKIAEDVVPVREVMALRGRGLPNEDIVKYLKKRGYSIAQIRDAITQIDIKTRAVGQTQDIPAPPPLPGMPPAAPVLTQPALPELPEMSGEYPPEPEEFGPPPIAPPTQGMGGMGPEMGEGQIEKIERIMEQIIEEKWREVTDRFRTLTSWKGKIEEKVNMLEEQIKQLNAKFDDINKLLVGKISEYGETMENVGTEVKAIEKVMGNIVPNLTDNIKELRELVGKIKTKKQK